MTTDDIATHLHNLRSMLDDADGTPLGQVGKLLDRMMAEVTAAERALDVMNPPDPLARCQADTLGGLDNFLTRHGYAAVPHVRAK